MGTYSYAISGTASEGYVVTNTHTPEETEATVTKEWFDANNQDGKRPASLTVNLMNGETVVATLTLNEANEWTATVTGLPKYADGVEIVYTWTEGEMPEGYELTDTSVNGTITTLTNTYTPKVISITGTKVWSDANNQDGIRPTSITINLKVGDQVIDSKVVTADDGWSFTFTDLPKYANGEEIEYTISENEVTGYTIEITNGEDNSFIVTNTHTPETISVNGTKIWNDANNKDGSRPKSIIINLLADGEKVASVTVTAESEWNFSFNDLAKYRDNGTEIVYTITEEPVNGYTTQINGYTVTNTHIPPDETPKTSDDSNMLMWVIGMLAGMTGLVGLAIVDNNDEDKKRARR